MELRLLTRNVRPEILDVAGDGAALLVDAVHGVDAVEKIVEVRRAQQNFDRRVRVARRVDVDDLARERRLRVLEVRARNTELEARALQVLTDARKPHVREVPTFDRGRELRLDRVDLIDDALRLCFFGGDRSGLRAGRRVDDEAHRNNAGNCRYVADSRPDGGVPVRGQKRR